MQIELKGTPPKKYCTFHDTKKGVSTSVALYIKVSGPEERISENELSFGVDLLATKESFTGVTYIGDVGSIYPGIGWDTTDFSEATRRCILSNQKLKVTDTLVGEMVSLIIEELLLFDEELWCCSEKEIVEFLTKEAESYLSEVIRRITSKRKMPKVHVLVV